MIPIKMQDRAAAGLQAIVQINRPKNGFQRIRQDRFAPKSPALEFSGSEAQPVSQLQSARQFGQGLAFYQAGSQSAQFAFAGLGIVPEQILGDHYVEQCIAQKFQPLVVAGRGAAVSEGFLQQLGLPEMVVQTGAQRSDGRIHGFSGIDSLTFSTTNNP